MFSLLLKEFFLFIFFNINEYFDSLINLVNKKIFLIYTKKSHIIFVNLVNIFFVIYIL